MGAARILIVDDNALNTELVRFVLDEAGHEVQTAYSAGEALVRIAEFQPQLILMDIQMPGMDGLELTRRLKEADATSAITIVAFTAYAMKGDEARMREAGCDGYISKPIDVKQFAAQVAQYLPASA